MEGTVGTLTVTAPVLPLTDVTGALCKALSALPKLVCTSSARSDLATVFLKANLPRSFSHAEILPISLLRLSPLIRFSLSRVLKFTVTLLPSPVLSSLPEIS